MSSTAQDNRWPHIAALLARRGASITLGHIAPIEGAAIAFDEQTLFASLVRRDGEDVDELLKRLDEAIGAAFHEGVITNEINGGKFCLARPRNRKKR
jgi:hypothetical protein